MAEEKIFSFKGKTFEELQKLSLKELSELLPSRTRRKINRGFTEAEKTFLKRVEAGEKKIKTHVRDMVVLPSMVDMKISIYNGKEFVEVFIVPDMIGMRFGELAMSRKIATHTTMGAKKTVTRK
jgi:small subunit ribosomal protein S19